MKTDATAIDVNVSSDVAELKEVVVGPVKAFDWDSLAAESDQDDLEAAVELVKHNRVEIPDPHSAAREHEAFVQLMSDRGIIVHFVDRLDDVAIQLYPRDMAFTVDEHLFLARSRNPVRRREQGGLDGLVPRISSVVELDAGVIEGGDVIVTQTDVLVGLGEETDLEAIAALRRAFDKVGVDREVVTLEFNHRGVVHLDTKFTMVGNDVGFVHREAFTPESLDRLDSRFDLIEVTEEEALDLQVNTLALDPQTIVIRENGDRLATILSDRGITPVLVDFYEIARFPGAFRCATLPLRRC